MFELTVPVRSATAQREVERHAKVIDECRTGQYQGHRVQTVVNGGVKPEGEAGTGHVRHAEEMPLLIDPFVKACLALKDEGNDKLVWRRYPAFEQNDLGYQLSARLVWVPINGE